MIFLMIVIFWLSVGIGTFLLMNRGYFEERDEKTFQLTNPGMFGNSTNIIDIVTETLVLVLLWPMVWFIECFENK
jgi:hypothetical protein